MVTDARGDDRIVAAGGVVRSAAVAAALATVLGAGEAVLRLPALTIPTVQRARSAVLRAALAVLTRLADVVAADDLAVADATAQVLDLGHAEVVPLDEAAERVGRADALGDLRVLTAGGLAGDTAVPLTRAAVQGTGGAGLVLAADPVAAVQGAGAAVQGAAQAVLALAAGAVAAVRGAEAAVEGADVTVLVVRAHAVAAGIRAGAAVAGAGLAGLGLGAEVVAADRGAVPAVAGAVQAGLVRVADPVTAVGPRADVRAAGARAAQARVGRSAGVAVLAGDPVGEVHPAADAAGRVTDRRDAGVARGGAGDHRRGIHRADAARADQRAVTQVPVLEIQAVSRAFAGADVLPADAEAGLAGVVLGAGGAVVAGDAVRGGLEGAEAAGRVTGVHRTEGVHAVVAEHDAGGIDRAGAADAEQLTVARVAVVEGRAVRVRRAVAGGGRRPSAEARAAHVVVRAGVAVVAGPFRRDEIPAAEGIADSLEADRLHGGRRRDPVAAGAGEAVGRLGARVHIVAGGVVLEGPQDALLRHGVAERELTGPQVREQPLAVLVHQAGGAGVVLGVLDPWDIAPDHGLLARVHARLVDVVYGQAGSVATAHRREEERRHDAGDRVVEDIPWSIHGSLPWVPEKSVGKSLYRCDRSRERLGIQCPTGRGRRSLTAGRPGGASWRGWRPGSGRRRSWPGSPTARDPGVGPDPAGDPQACRGSGRAP